MTWRMHIYGCIFYLLAWDAFAVAAPYSTVAEFEMSKRGSYYAAFTMNESRLAIDGENTDFCELKQEEGASSIDIKTEGTYEIMAELPYVGTQIFGPYGASFSLLGNGQTIISDSFSNQFTHLECKGSLLLYWVGKLEAGTKLSLSGGSFQNVRVSGSKLIIFPRDYLGSKVNHLSRMMEHQADLLRQQALLLTALTKRCALSDEKCSLMEAQLRQLQLQVATQAAASEAPRARSRRPSEMTAASVALPDMGDEDIS